MMSFWQKKNERYLNSEEFESISKKITSLSSELEEIKNKFKVLETNYDNLRGNFNRKLRQIRFEDEEEQEQETKSINNPVILPENEFTFKRR
jgi:archaellum component FlaC